ncbi:MAG TPA: hypothetical protein VK581_11415 [Chthoniobacterales bacterium]|nr:hypothetical protein [Chthoniobacterales bacterium]
MKRDDDQKLWDLLGCTAEPKVSPFFARNVVRQIRQSGAPTGRRWFGLHRLAPATGVAIALIAVISLRTHSSVPPASEFSSDKLAVVSSQDYDVIADLDDLTSDDNNSLDDSVLL